MNYQQHLMQQGEQRGKLEGMQIGEQRGMQLGKLEGMQIGEQLGEQRGMQLGKLEAKLEVAKKLLEAGLTIEQIAEVTGLPKNKIKNKNTSH